MTTPGMKSFAIDLNVVPFEVGGEVFECTRTLPADVVVEFTNLGDDLKGDAFSAQYDVMKSMLDMALLPESAARFRARLQRGAERPIPLEVLSDVVVWLIGEVTADRPTQPAESLPATPDETGTPSTDGAPVPE